MIDFERVLRSRRSPPMRRISEAHPRGFRSLRIDLFGMSCLCLGLDALIANKRAAGRPKDLEAVAELEVIRDRRRRSGAS